MVDGYLFQYNAACHCVVEDSSQTIAYMIYSPHQAWYCPFFKLTLETVQHNWAKTVNNDDLFDVWESYYMLLYSTNDRKVATYNNVSICQRPLLYRGVSGTLNVFQYAS